MISKTWSIFVATAVVQMGLLVGTGWLIWRHLSPPQQQALTAVWAHYAGLAILAGVALVGVLGLAVNLLARWYIAPLRPLAEETRVVAMSNCRHRLAPLGGAETRELIAAVNLLAERHQSLQEDVQVRIREANAVLEEEKNTLAALMSKLTQGVLVCNREGRILLYNQRAQTLLEGPTRHSGGADWIGLGRSVYSLLDQDLLHHALVHIEHRLQQGDTGLMAPFIASRPGGQLLSVHLAPILDKNNSLTGYILTLEDITRRTATESRRGLLLQSLTEGQRSALAGIRAAIETVLVFPDMEEASRQQFLTVIRDEALKLSQNLDHLETEYAQDLQVHWPLEKMVGSELLAAIEHRLQDTAGIPLEMSAPLEPLWLQVDSYAVVQLVLFVITQLRDRYRGQNLELKLENQGAFACLCLLWEGAALNGETLHSWEKQAIMTDRHGSSLSLHDIVERHGGALWSETETASGRCCLRLLLPPAADDPVAMEHSPKALLGQDYDFHLLNQSGQPTDLDELPLNALSYTVFDTETTGLNPGAGDEIIAIGAVRIVNGRILQREIFDCLINPGRPIAPAATEIHGISTQMLRGMPPSEEVLPRFRRFVEDTVLVGHNAAFDMRFLEIKETQLGVKFTNPVLDTLLLAWVVHPNQEEQSLETIAGRFGVTVTGRHTALGDALATAEVFLALIPLLAERGIHTLGQAQAAAATTEYAKIKY